MEPLPNPDYQLRKKILEFKSKKNGLGLPEDVIDAIATEIDGSVRELETIVNGLLTRSIVKNAPLSVELAREVMSHVVKRTERKPINFDMIVESTAEYFNLNPDAIFSQSRLRDIADARQMIMFLSHKHTQLSSPAIGAKLTLYKKSAGSGFEDFQSAFETDVPTLEKAGIDRLTIDLIIDAIKMDLC